MDPSTLLAVAALMAVAAALYSSVGHGGASAVGRIVSGATENSAMIAR